MDWGNVASYVTAGATLAIGVMTLTVTTKVQRRSWVRDQRREVYETLVERAMLVFTDMEKNPPGTKPWRKTKVPAPTEDPNGQKLATSMLMFGSEELVDLYADFMTHFGRGQAHWLGNNAEAWTEGRRLWEALVNQARKDLGIREPWSRRSGRWIRRRWRAVRRRFVRSMTSIWRASQRRTG